MSIDINRDVVRNLGVACDAAGTTVKPAAGRVEDGYLPNTELMCRSMWSICQGVWSSTFTQLTDALTGTGSKLQNVANLVGGTDTTIADQFRPIATTAPDEVNVPGGRHYA